MEHRQNIPYIGAFGANGEALSHFDIILDVSEIYKTILDEYKTADAIRCEKIKRISRIEEVIAELEKTKPELTVLFHPIVSKKEYDLTEKLMKCIQESSSCWKILDNKRLIRKPLSVNTFLSTLKVIHKKCARRKSDLRPSALYTTNSLTSPNLFSICRPKKTVFVQHMSISGGILQKLRRKSIKSKGEKKILVHVDQFIPFHQDFKTVEQSDGKGIRFYSVLSDTLNMIALDRGLDDVVFCAHPNSDGREDALIDSHYVRDVTLDYISVADAISGFYSEALEMTILAGHRPIIIALPEDWMGSSARQMTFEFLGRWGLDGYEILVDGSLVAIRPSIHARIFGKLQASFSRRYCFRAAGVSAASCLFASLK